MKKKLNPFIQYSSMGFLMIAFVLIGLFLGQFLDDYFQIQKDYFTISLTFAGVIFSLVYVVRKIIKNLNK